MFRRFFDNFEKRVLGTDIHSVTVGEDIDFLVAVIRLDESVRADMLSGFNGITAEFAACLSEDNVRVNTAFDIFAGFADTAGLAVLTVFTKKQTAVIICESFSSRTLFAEKQYSFSGFSEIHHIFERRNELFIAINRIFHSEAPYFLILRLIIIYRR